MLNKLLPRWKQSRSRSSQPLSEHSTVRGAAVHPPGQRPDDSLLQSLLRWLPREAEPWGDTPAQARARCAQLLPQLRADFEASLCDVPAAEELRRSIKRGRSLDDFWHLRGWLYTEVARALSQREAELRLAHINRHFTDPLDAFFFSGPNRRQ